MGATVLYEDRVVTIADAREDGARLWLAPADFEAATGWTLKPEGLCQGSACVPLPRDGSWTDADGRVDLTAFAARFKRPIVHDAQRQAWAFGSSVGERLEQVESLQAPDFTLPDLDGRPHSLSDFRGRKVFLMSWGSYCGCRADLPLWQVLYEELKDQGFEIVAVALDTGGRAATEPSIRPNLAEVPEIMGTMMGWSRDVWDRMAVPTYTCLIDEEHVLAELYGMNNVPVAVWINEDGRIVRPVEPAGATDNFRQLDAATFELPEEEVSRLASNRQQYWDALRDWVAKGDDSEFALSPEQARAAMRRPGEEDIRAAAHARLGRHLFAAGDHEGAKHHFRAAVELAPKKWNYRRQSMMLDPESIGELNAGEDFFTATASLGTRGYYDPIEMPGIQPDPLVTAPAGTPFTEKD